MDDLSGWTRIGYIAACIAVPAAWGALCAWLFSRKDRKVAGGDDRGSSVDYMI